MQRKFVSAIILVAVLFSAHSGFAGPLAFYTDEAAWLQAVSGHQVGTYPYEITRTDYITLYDYDPNVSPSITVVGNTTNLPGSWSNGIFQPAFYANFSSAGLIIDEGCWGVPCSGIPGLTETAIHFETPIYGIAGFGYFSGSVQVNDQWLPFPFVPDGVSGFIGIAGEVSELDFVGGCTVCDDFSNYIDLNNVIVAFLPVPEPSSIVALSSMLLFLGLIPFAGLAERKHRRRALH
jgi:hypothetical protein